MAETYQFGLPLLASGQAQKHVTVNEALARLDAVAQLRVISDTAAAPPGSAVDGQAWIVAPGASGGWAGQESRIALFVNGGWDFLVPKPGWSAWIEDSGTRVEYVSGPGWVGEGTGGSPSGAMTKLRVWELSHVLSAGGSSTVTGAVPANSVVFGVTGRVTTAIGGSVSSWSLGVPGSTNRYGSGLGTGQNSYALGLTGAPVTYYTAEDLVLTADSGSFSGGEVMLAVHGLVIQPPAAV